MDKGNVLASRDGAVGWLVFDHPGRHNAITPEMWRKVPDILAQFETDPDVRVVVIRGAGERAFVSGADISQYERNHATSEDAARTMEIIDRGRAAIRNMVKPTIAMIRGYCLGGGVGVALLCDLRIASDDARFGIPATRLGIAYSFASTKLLCDRIGVANAKEMLLTARRYSALEALEMGLVNRVVPSVELERQVRDYASEIAGNAPLALAAAKLVLKTVDQEPAERDFAALQLAADRCSASEDVREGHRAFMEKRKPVFRGR